MLKRLSIILLSAIMICTLTGCSNVFKADTPSLEEKVDEEIEYLDSEIISLLNSLNSIIYTNYKVVPTEVKQSNTASNPNSQMNESGGTQNSEQKESLETSGEGGENSQQSSGGKSSSSEKSSKTDQKTLKMEPNTILSINTSQIDWNKTKSDIEILYTAWITVRIDMKELGINEELLNNFSMELNDTIIAIKNEDKTKTMQSLVNMYSILYEFINSYCDDRFKVYTIEAKKHTLAAYNYIENSKWEEAENQLEQSEQKFGNVENFGNIQENKKVDIERANVLIKEMKDSLQLKDKEVALLKYKDLIQELSIL